MSPVLAGSLSYWLTLFEPLHPSVPLCHRAMVAEQHSVAKRKQTNTHLLTAVFPISV